MSSAFVPVSSIAPVVARDAPRTAFVAAWVVCLVFYFLQYALRSGVMIPELTATFGRTALGISALLGLYYYTYAGFAIVAGESLDRFGAKLPIFVGVMTVAAGSVLFGFGSIGMANSGRLLQGAGSAFAFTVLSLVLTFFLRETGGGARRVPTTPASSAS